MVQASHVSNILNIYRPEVNHLAVLGLSVPGEARWVAVDGSAGLGQGQREGKGPEVEREGQEARTRRWRGGPVQGFRR